MLVEESPTSRRSLSHIFIQWVTLGLYLILLAASRGIGVCQNMLTWLVQHATCHGSVYGMISNDDVVVNNSRVVRVESLRSFLKGSPLKMHNVFNMSEGKWNAADYYGIAENGHDIITEQPISEIKCMHCKAGIDDDQSHTGYQSIRSFRDTIRKNHMVPPGDACTLMSACEDVPALPERCMQWFLLNCIAMVAIYELQMINFRNIQDPEFKTDAHGSSFRNMVNWETDFASKKPCVSSSGAGSELKNQSDMKSRNQVSDSCTNMIQDTDTSNVPKHPRNSDTHRQEGEHGYHSAAAAPRPGDTSRCLWNVTEVINNVSETDSNVNKDDKPEGSDNRADGMDEADGMTVSDKRESEMRVDDKREGSTRHVGGKKEGSDTQIVGRSGGSDSKAGLTQDDIEVQADGKQERSDIQVDSRLGGSDMEVDRTPERSDIQAGSIPETDVYTLTGADQIPNMKTCLKKPKKQRKGSTHCCVSARILSGLLRMYKQKLRTSMIYRFRDRRKRFFVNQGKRPQPFRGSKNIPCSTSGETWSFQFLSTTRSLPRSSHTSQNFETNRQTEEAFFKGQGHHRCAGNPKACSDFVEGLLYQAGDNTKTFKLKEKLKFLLRPDQQLCELQTVKGLAMHCLPKKEPWEIQRLMEIERRGRPHETCVDHVLQELVAHGLKVGHVVQYFSQHDSRRHDVVRVIEKIHVDCEFCTCLYNW
ncbi:uncharacterized protein LOC124270390 [Haliotis rubra]|uniref:uncharacterized protein LOC124270390 n=1 Tax=Haliotis rubra TaxID=36100 RepID=UPI001EE5AD4B|nr:uncharacterized protein LOC124270390 [Haliotis rubra]